MTTPNPVLETPQAPQAQPQQEEVRLPEWIVNLIGRQALELEILRQQISATQAQVQDKSNPDGNRNNGGSAFMHNDLLHLSSTS